VFGVLLIVIREWSAELKSCNYSCVRELVEFGRVRSATDCN
jgi:hypothetical protein